MTTIYNDDENDGRKDLEFVFDSSEISKNLPHSEEDLATFDDSAFTEKVKNFAGGFSFAKDLAASYFAMKDSKTPVSFRLALAGALVYFVVPLDAVPDVIPIVGYLDDTGVLAAAIAFAASAIKPSHLAKANEFFSSAKSEKKVPAKKVPAKKVPAKKVPAKKVPAKKVPAKKVPAKKKA